MKQTPRTKSLLALALLLVLVAAPDARMLDLTLSATNEERPESGDFLQAPQVQEGYLLVSADEGITYYQDGLVHIVEVDLNNPHIRFQVLLAHDRDRIYGQANCYDADGNPYCHESIEAMAERHGAVVAINGDYSGDDYYDQDPNPHMNEGVTFINGQSVNPDHPPGGISYRHYLAISAANDVIIRKGQINLDDYMFNVMGGGPEFIVNDQYVPNIEQACLENGFGGPPYWCHDSYSTQQTAAGIVYGGGGEPSKLLLAMSPAAITLPNMATVMIRHGVREAIRFDGGHVSEMYVNASLVRGGTWAPSALAVFTDAGSPPPAPSLSSPSNDASIRSCENITLDWNESSGASEYYAEYWGASSGNSEWISGTDWNIGTKSPGTYYWHIKARNQYGQSDWSDTWSFTVNPNQAPNTPSPQSPSNGDWVNSHTVTLQWQDNGDDGCPRDATYNVEIWRSGWSDSVSDHSGTSWQVTVPTDDDYQWRVQAYDGDLTSPWSDSRTVKVDATAPDTSITSGPEGDIPVGDVSFSWAGLDNRTPTGDLVYSYRLRGLSDNWSAWAGSTSVSYSGLPDGDYTFEVKAKDLAGNEDPTPANRSFFVDTTPPETTITSGPSGCIGAADATFTWTGSDNRTSTDQLQYSFWLEGYDIGWSGWSSATSKTYTGLPDGPYTLHVKARDGVGHEDPTPATRSFRVDTTPPAGSVLINSGDSTTTQIAVRLDITGDDGPLGCGVTHMRLANDDHNYGDWRGFEEQISWYLPPVNRTTWAVHLQLKDLVGNVSGAFTDDIYLDFYPLRPESESYQLGARIAAGGDGRPTSESYQLDGATLGQALGGGRGRSPWYRLDSGFQGAWPSVPGGRPPAEEYDVWDSVMAGSGDAPRSERYRLYETGGQPVADSVRTSESYQLVSGFWLPAGWDVCGDDFDRDGIIGAGDIQRQIAHWRTSMGNRDPDRNPDTPNYAARFDRNLDGTVNTVDVMRLVVRWGRRCIVRNP